MLENYDQQVAMARQLVDACSSAETDEDEQYAADELEGFVDGLDEATETPVFIALLAVPRTELTGRSLDYAEKSLAERGPAVVEALMKLSFDEGETGAHALEALDWMPVADLAIGSTEVLAGDGDDELKQLAADTLVALGADALRQIENALHDPVARPWAEDALRGIRLRGIGAGDPRVEGALGAADTGGAEADDEDTPAADDDEGVAAGDAAEDETTAVQGGGTSEASAAGDPASADQAEGDGLPSSDDIAADLQAFLKRMDEEKGR